MPDLCSVSVRRHGSDDDGLRERCGCVDLHTYTISSCQAFLQPVVLATTILARMLALRGWKRRSDQALPNGKTSVSSGGTAVGFGLRCGTVRRPDALAAALLARIFAFGLVVPQRHEQAPICAIRMLRGTHGDAAAAAAGSSSFSFADLRAVRDCNRPRGSFRAIRARQAVPGPVLASRTIRIRWAARRRDVIVSVCSRKRIGRPQNTVIPSGIVVPISSKRLYQQLY
jgi:hypothetical protein